MNIITGQMPLMGYAGNAQSAGQNNVVAGVRDNFMQQILMGENAGQALVNITSTLELEKNQIDIDPKKNYAVATASEVLSKFNVSEVVLAQDPALQPKEARQISKSISESTVVYLLHWLATGHLSHIVLDITASMPEQINHPAILAAAKNGSSSSDLQPSKKLIEISFEENKVRFRHFDNNALDIDAAEHEYQRKAADSAIFNEQISPYLKRRLIVSTQEDHTHIILRDYFLDDQGNFSELKDLFTNIKQNISGNIQLTINGHHYGDINNYR